MLNLESKLQYVKGIGGRRAQALAKLAVKTVEDALTFFPNQYQDRTKIVSIEEACKCLQSCIFGRVGEAYEKTLRRGLCLLDIEIFDKTSVIYARFFRKKKMYSNIDVFARIKRDFKRGVFAYIYGKAEFSCEGRLIFVSDYETVINENDIPLLFKKIMPIYPTTEGVNQKFIRETLKNVLKLSCKLYPDVSNLMPDYEGVPKLSSPLAIQKIHYPDNLECAENARRAFALQEFFVLESALFLWRRHFRRNHKVQRYEVKKTLLTDFKNKLNFKFTRDQKKAINIIFSDMRSVYPMNRMLMGDVGSGKTVVALSAVLLAVENDYQAIVIAPTEILAEQHYHTILSMLSGVGVKIALATSSTLEKKRERERIFKEIENNEIKIAVGTHSLLEDRVKFKRLSLIVVDEQHKFGVMQKFAALNKAQSPDILMMSATPIPRSLSMTIYGDMDITAIANLPPGRIPVKTYVSDEQTAYTNAVKELENGNQAYIVYPLIEESEKLALKSLMRDFEKLSHTWFKDFKTGLLHSKMTLPKRSEVLRRFKNKELNILMSTTVIEVGIDVPDATVMIIQHAERFGLSELHQLRGRIGRSSKQSYVYLITDSKNENACKRISIMTSTNDGFKIAEKDLKMRGPGELTGTAQHGFPKFKAGDLTKDVDIIEFAKNCAVKIIEDDPGLSKNENSVLKKLIYKRFPDKMKFIRTG